MLVPRRVITASCQILRWWLHGPPSPFPNFVLVDLVTYVEFPVSERILARDPMEEIRRAFQLFDDDNTGKISLRNLRRVAKEIGDRLEDDEL